MPTLEGTQSAENSAERFGIVGAEEVPGIVAFDDGMEPIDPTAPEELERMLAAMKDIAD